MEDKNCDELFEYLRSILYDPKVKPLDMESLDEPYQKLGMGLQFLEKAVKEMKEYSAALSTQQPFREEICRCSRLRERIFCAKI